MIPCGFDPRRPDCRSGEQRPRWHGSTIFRTNRVRLHHDSSRDVLVYSHRTPFPTPVSTPRSVCVGCRFPPFAPIRKRRNIGRKCLIFRSIRCDLGSGPYPARTDDLFLVRVGTVKIITTLNRLHLRRIVNVMNSDPTPVTTPASKPDRPADSPFFWHRRGYWAKKIAGRQVSFGADHAAALRMYHRMLDQQAAGNLPRQPRRAGLLRDAINTFLSRQLERRADGEIGDVQLIRYRDELETHLLATVSKTTRLAEFADDDAPALFRKIRNAAKARGLESFRKHVVCVRAMLNYANRRARIMAPANYCDAFDPPAPEEFRAAKHASRAELGERTWTAQELARIVADAADDPIYYAQVLLGLTLGMDAADISDLTVPMIDRERACIYGIRSKTKIEFVAPLLPHVIEAVDAAYALRPRPSEKRWAKRIFLTPDGLPIVRRHTHADAAGDPESYTRTDALGQRFKRRVKGLGLKRHRAGFKTLRACFHTLASDSGHSDLVSIIVGHQFGRPIREYYLRGDLLEKLRGVVAHVWHQVKQTPESP